MCRMEPGSHWIHIHQRRPTVLQGCLAPVHVGGTRRDEALALLSALGPLPSRCEMTWPDSMLPPIPVPKTKVPPTLGAGDAVTAKSLPAVLSSLSFLSREKTGNDGHEHKNSLWALDQWDTFAQKWKKKKQKEEEERKLKKTLINNL